jgi:hypothetical protein
VAQQLKALGAKTGKSLPTPLLEKAREDEGDIPPLN